MDYDGSFEWILQQLKIAVSLPRRTADDNIIDAFEEFRMEDSDKEAIRVLAYVVADRSEFMISSEYAVIKILLKYACSGGGQGLFFCQLAAFHFHHSDIASKCFRQVCLSKNGEMNMVRHDDIFQNSQRRVEISEVENLIFDYLADCQQLDSRLIRSAGYAGEIRDSGRFGHRDMIDTSTFVVMVIIAWHKDNFF